MGSGGGGGGGGGADPAPIFCSKRRINHFRLEAAARADGGGGRADPCPEHRGGGGEFRGGGREFRGGGGEFRGGGRAFGGGGRESRRRAEPAQPPGSEGHPLVDPRDRSPSPPPLARGGASGRRPCSPDYLLEPTHQTLMFDFDQHLTTRSRRRIDHAGEGGQGGGPCAGLTGPQPNTGQSPIL